MAPFTNFSEILSNPNEEGIEFENIIGKKAAIFLSLNV